jgi:hypothetical protein
MNPDQVIRSLAKNLDLFKAQLHDKPNEEYTFKPSPDKWSMLEVACHLVDEEKEDFKIRVEYVLDDPTQPLPKFNPVYWVQSRNYSGQNFDDKVEELLNERTKSITWLESLQDPQWDNTYNHPTLGPMSAGLFLANWLAHDYIHIRQLNRLAYEFHQHQSDIDLSYAGNW